jgi:chromosome segregation ATPase
MDKLKDVIKELGDNAGKTGEELERANKAESERDSLQRRLYEVTGNTAAIRALELAALEPANRALQQRVWALEDAKKAESEGESLQRRLYELSGNTAAIRALELAALEPATRALQERVWALEDANKAESEQETLQRQIYELTGNTAAIRALELAALEPANRALQEQVWALEDAKKALDDLTTDSFATLLDYERAVARARNGVQTGTGPGGLVPLPPPVTTPSAPDSQAAVVVELKAVRAEVARLREEQAAQGKTGLGYGKDTRDILLKFDRTGMPAVRT